MIHSEQTDLERHISALEIVDRICEEFERSRAAGQSADIEEYLSRAAPEIRDELFVGLLRSQVLSECLQRREPSDALYFARFPDRKEAIRAVFLELKEHHPQLNPADPSPSLSESRESREFTRRFERHFMLGVGGQGEVWLARDRELQRFVALKVIKESERGYRESQTRFWREALVTSKLEHPNIVPVYEAGKTTGPGGETIPYYAMRVYGNRHLLSAFTAFHSAERGPGDQALLEALTALQNERSPANEAQLQAALDRCELDESRACDRELRKAVEALLADRTSHSRRNLREAIDACHRTGRPEGEFRELLTRFIDVCNALAYAHSQGVIHRDLKPENVMLGEFGETLVVDWGLAKVIANGTAAETQSAAATVIIRDGQVDDDSATRTGDLNGTLSYMSPEQAWGRIDELRPATDIYSLGAMLYAILTGQPPRSGTFHEQRTAAQQGWITPPRSVRPDVPHALEAVCLKAMSKSPEQRYPTAKELANDVSRWLAGEPVSAWCEPAFARIRRWARRRPALTATACVTMLAAGIASIAFGIVQQGFVEDLQTEVSARKRQSALSEWDLAHRLCEDGDVAHGMLVMAQVLESLPQDAKSADIEQSLRLELAGWQRQIHMLTQVWEHPAPVTCLAVTSDGGLVATGCADGNVRIWDVESGELQHVLTGHAGELTSLAFVSDTKQLVSAGLDGRILLWNIESEEFNDLANLGVAVNCVAVSPDGEWVVCGSADARVRLWRRFGDHHALHADLRQAGTVHAVGFSPSGRRFFAGSANESTRRGELFLYDIDTVHEASVQLRNESDRQFAFAVRSAAFSPDGRFLLVGDDDWNATLWDSQSGEQLATSDYAQGQIVAAAFSPDGMSAVLAGEYSQQALIWNIAGVLGQVDNTSNWGVHYSVNHSRTPINSLIPHPDAVTATAFVGHDNDRFLTACRDGSVRLWRRAPGSDMIVLPHHPRLAHQSYSPQREYVVRTVAFHPGGQLVATGGWDGTIQLWDTDDGTPVGDRLYPPEGDSPVMSMAFLPGGKSIVAGAKDGMIRIWDIATGTCTAELPHHCAIVSGLSVSEDGLLLLAGGDGQARLWDLTSVQATNVRLRHSETDASIATAISPSGDRFLTAGEDGEVKVWDRNGRLVAVLPHELGVWNGSFRGDGRQIVTASDDESVRVWNTRDGDLDSAIQHECSVFAAEFLASAEFVVTASRDGGQIWSLTLQRRLGPPCRHEAEAIDVRLSPDGQTAVLADWNGYGLIWRMPQPLEGTADEITATVEAMLGMQLDSAGGMIPLTAAQWQDRQEILAD